MSAKNVVKYFDYKRYKLVLVYWHKQDGRFYLVKNIEKLVLTKSNILPAPEFTKKFDVALLMTHGKYGEDGVLQAILESHKVKYCGCRVLGSALCMDKIVFKKLMQSENIRQVRYGVLDFKAQTKTEIATEKKRIKKEFHFPMYVKPSNSGSSVGITKINKYSELAGAIEEALKHDKKIVIEEGLVSPKEIEVAVLGNKELIVSRPGELRLVKDFYNFDDKYKLGQAQAHVPAQITSAQTKEIRRFAAAAYRLAGCQGFARVDFFIAKNKIYLNEINTLPGFTDISMFPMLMMDQGMSYTELLNKIIALAY